MHSAEVREQEIGLGSANGTVNTREQVSGRIVLTEPHQYCDNGIYHGNIADFVDVNPKRIYMAYERCKFNNRGLQINPKSNPVLLF